MTIGTPSRRGVALLITLAAVVIAVVACASLARVAVTTSVTRVIDARDELAADLLHAVETPIQKWLRERSSHVVLSPDVTTPSMAVLDDLIEVGSDTVRLHITAWDQRGMPSSSLLVRGVPMRAGLPSEVIARVDNARKMYGDTLDTSPGLDLYAGTETLYPQSQSESPMRFGNPSEPMLLSPTHAALGAFVATHNPPIRKTPSRRRRSSKPQPAINVNTAPIDVVESALRMAGLRGIEQIIDARERGEPATAAGRAGSTTGQAHPNAPALVASSDAWSMRIDASIGSQTRSWWAVYVKEQGAWRCVQRLAINQ